MSHNAPYLPRKFCIGIVFNFSWDGCDIQGKWKTKVMPGAHGLLVMKNFGWQIRCIMGDVQVAYGIEKRDGNWAELNFRKDFWVCYFGRDHKNWPIADQRIPRNNPRNKCGMHFSSSSLHLWRMVMYGVTRLPPIHRWSRRVLRHFPEVRIVFAFSLQMYKFFSHSQLWHVS